MHGIDSFLMIFLILRLRSLIFHNTLPNNWYIRCHDNVTGFREQGKAGFPEKTIRQSTYVFPETVEALLCVLVLIKYNAITVKIKLAYP